MTAISFTASRFNFAPPPPVVASVLSARVPPADRYVTGACQGGDAWIGAWLYVARPAAEHVVVVPYNRRQIDPWWTRTGSLPLVTVREMPPGTSYADRNRVLVDSADQVFGFPAFSEEDPRSQRSGTWQTIRMARDAGKLRLWQCITPPYLGRTETLAGEPDLTAPACVMHGQPLAWCRAGYRDEHDRDGGEPCSEHQPWCGDASLSRPDDECTCAITPEMQYAQRDQSEAELGLAPREYAVNARHQPRRGDDVEAWLRGWRDLLGGDPWHAVNGLLHDYQSHADTGTPLDTEAGEHE